MLGYFVTACVQVWVQVLMKVCGGIMCIPTANGESSSAVSVRWCGHYSWLKLVCEARRPGRNLRPTVRCVSTVWVLTLHESQVHECNYSKSNQQIPCSKASSFAGWEGGKQKTSSSSNLGGWWVGKQESSKLQRKFSQQRQRR